ncbi:hypothetical protein FJW04_23825 [Mesorhizobium sp. B2-7-3]|uniref:hypothetical protein n=1 Tax=unclassified Mesorhizobium TaxID=325217 RepID=UPI00112A9758|nr:MULTISPECIES: hypothetical protein [unclassified Mesorhizobium]MBZ9905255.1 hypothetical protein [Mesorhizobium sp. BR115XR7A]MBZ9931070.1 hypothetical protein [Mesorhizobium sp. BR1-1-5]TPJ12265.1 hypothetical protein FJW04_23825 [Mesorhizobium sp. B2-7-3]
MGMAQDCRPRVGVVLDLEELAGNVSLPSECSFGRQVSIYPGAIAIVLLDERLRFLPAELSELHQKLEFVLRYG